MASYSLRLLKKTKSAKMTFEEVERIDFEAEDDVAAKAKAPHLEVFEFDDSDLAVVFDQHGKVVWRLYA